MRFSPSDTTSSSGSTGLNTCRILRLSAPELLFEMTLPIDAIDERCEDGARNELRGIEIHDAVDWRLFAFSDDDDAAGGPTERRSALPMNGANGRGSVPCAA